jgi:hypothetical protein
MFRYCQKLDLTIQQDWNAIIDQTLRLLALEEKASSETVGASDHYLLGQLGTISKHNPSKSWYRVASPVVNRSMPWLVDWLDSMSELKPDDSCISFLRGNGKEHIDVPEMKTALNFIIANTDSEAFTWIRDGEIYETYPSKVNTAWLIDTQKLHGIENVGERWSLSIHFNEEYEVVKSWFDNRPNLKYGNTITGEQ